MTCSTRGESSFRSSDLLRDLLGSHRENAHQIRHHSYIIFATKRWDQKGKSYRRARCYYRIETAFGPRRRPLLKLNILLVLTSFFPLYIVVNAVFQRSRYCLSIQSLRHRRSTKVTVLVAGINHVCTVFL